MAVAPRDGIPVPTAPEQTPPGGREPSDTPSEVEEPSQNPSEALEGQAQTPPVASPQQIMSTPPPEVENITDAFDISMPTSPEQTPSEGMRPSQTPTETPEGGAPTPPDATHASPQQIGTPHPEVENMAGETRIDVWQLAQTQSQGGGASQTRSEGGGGGAFTPSDALKMIMAALKIRSRVFTEGIMTMACPVILAITRDIVKPKLDKSKFGRLIILLIAMAAFEIGIVQFLVICLPSTVNSWICKASKILIHLCVVLLMVLASLVMSLIGLPSLRGYLLVMGIVGVFTIYMCYLSWHKDDQVAGMTKDDFEKLKGSLDLTANFSAAVTAVLFLGIELLALEELMSAEDHELQRMLTFPLASSFWTWVLGLVTMLLVSVHPLISRKPSMMFFLDILSAGLAIGLLVVVYYITAQAMGEKHRLTMLFLAVPCLPVFTWLGYVSKGCWWGTNSETPNEEELEPASLELIKITFAAFLAVTVATAKETPSPTNNFTMVMVFKWFSATAIFTGLEWRFATHWKKVPHAVARGADFANFIFHLCMAGAVIPLAVLAAEAVKRASQAAT